MILSVFIPFWILVDFLDKPMWELSELLVDLRSTDSVSMVVSFISVEAYCDKWSELFTSYSFSMLCYLCIGKISFWKMLMVGCCLGGSLCFYLIIDIIWLQRPYKLFNFITNFVNNLDKIFEFTKSKAKIYQN